MIISLEHFAPQSRIFCYLFCTVLKLLEAEHRNDCIFQETDLFQKGNHIARAHGIERCFMGEEVKHCQIRRAPFAFLLNPSPSDLIYSILVTWTEPSCAQDGPGN